MNDPTPTGGQIRPFAHSVLVVVLAFALGIGLGIPGALVMALLGFTISPPSTWVIAVTSSLQYVGFMIVVGGYLVYANATALVRVRVPSLGDLFWMGAGLVGLFATVSLVGALITVLGADQAQNTVVALGQENPDLFLWMIPITVLFVAPGEELVFRGIVQGLFRRTYGALPAILLASVFFGVVHYVALAGSGKLTYILVAVLLGVVLGTLYERTENILVPIVVHGLYNAVLFGGQWFVAVNDVSLPS